MAVNIPNYIDKLIEEHRTADPFKLANGLNIHIRYVVTNEEFKGLYVELQDNQLIILNEHLKARSELLRVISHELAHALLHKGISKAYHESEEIREQSEKEADMFADLLLMRYNKELEGVNA